MYTEQSVIAFAKWWYGTEADGVFKGHVNVSVEQGFEWWKNNRAVELEESAPSASTNSRSSAMSTLHTCGKRWCK